MICVAGCQKAGTETSSQNDISQLETKHQENIMQKITHSFSIDKSKKCQIISCVNTAQKDVSLTFDGMGDENTIYAILDQLDKCGIKSVFFLPGMRVAEEPEIAKEIVKRGHTIGNNTLNKIDLTKLDYENIYKEIKLSHDVIVEKTGVSPKYLRTRFGEYNDDVQFAASQCGYEAIVTYSINPQDWDMKNAQQIADIVEKKLSKGSVIMLNTDRNSEVIKAIPLIKKAVESSAYHIVPLEQMISDQLPGIDVSSIHNSLNNNDINEAISYAYTTKPQMALTFDGMGDVGMVGKILDQLDKCNIKATFFLPGVRVAENPEIAMEILKRGHSIQSNTFDKANLTNLTYDEIYKQIKLSHEIIVKKTGVVPKYIRPGFGKFNNNVFKAASQCGYEGVVTYTINTHEWDMKDAKTIADIVKKGISRGRIILLNTDSNPAVVDAIPLIAEVVSQAGQKLVTLEELLDGQYERLPVKRIPGYYSAKITSDYKSTEYHVIKTGSSDKNQIAITFDDWANDIYLSEILKVLKKHNIKATFFLRGNGVERNPNLARLILEEGHEVANHTYNHKVVTGISPEELQQEVVKCHQILSQALGQSPKLYFRPPTGVIDDESAKAIAACGYKTIVMYDISPRDFKSETSIDDIVRETLSTVVPGSNVVLHLQDDMKTAKALDIVINQLKIKDYKLVTVSKLFNLE